MLEGKAYAGGSEAVLDHFSATKAVDLLATGGEYTINMVVLIVGAAAALLFWFTRERFYLWFAGYLIFEASFFVTDRAGEHQAWNFYLYTYLNILIDVCSGIALSFFIAAITYSQSTFILPTAARLTLLSDGVVEARSRTGELFGFDRTSEVSQLSASEIATKAHHFGQQHDITVIILDWHAGALAVA